MDSEHGVRTWNGLQSAEGDNSHLSPRPKFGRSFRLMMKAVQLLVTVTVEGDDEPAHDFPRRAMAAVRDAVKVGRARHPGLMITVDRIERDSPPPRTK
jgi:hypothetical protein